MNKAARTIRTTPRSELALLIEDAAETGRPLVVDTGETIYRLSITSRVEAQPRSKQLGDRMMSFAGVWRDLDGDQLLERLDWARHASPPSPPVEG